MKRVPLIVMATILAISLVHSGVVMAHAMLTRTDPKAGSTLKAAPKVVRAFFDDQLDTGSTISVWDSKGKRVDLGKGGIDPSDKKHQSLIVRLPKLGPGTYTVKWKSFTADDNKTTEATFQFTVAMSH